MTTSKSYMVVGNFTDNEAYVCSTPEMAREIFCNILKQKPLEKYFTEEQLTLFNNLVKHRKMRKAYRHWRAYGSDDDLRIKSVMQVAYKQVIPQHKTIENFGLSSRDLFGI